MNCVRILVTIANMVVDLLGFPTNPAMRKLVVLADTVIKQNGLWLRDPGRSVGEWG